MNRPYHVSALAPAAHDLARLDKPIAQRIVRRLEWLAANLDEVQPEALKGQLADFFKLRIGDYRVVYENTCRYSGLEKSVALVKLCG